MMFRAADVVKHAPSGETWVLACDQDREYVIAAGWPETMAKAADCTLVTAASDVERLAMLTRASSRSPGHGSSYRRSLAQHQLTDSQTTGGLGR